MEEEKLTSELKVSSESELYIKDRLLEIEAETRDKRGLLKRQRVFIIFLVMVLLGMSIMNMISTSFYSAILSGESILSGNTFKHIIWISIGSILGLITMAIPSSLFKVSIIKLALLMGSLVILVTVVILGQIGSPLVPRINGSLSWVRFGPITVQPAEVLKIVYIILIANTLQKSQANKDKSLNIIIKCMILYSLFGGLVLAQRDMGTALHYLLLTVFMLMVSDVSKKLIISLLSLGTAIYISVVGIFYYFPVSGGYKLQRIKSYVDILYRDVDRDLGVGYQVSQSLIAMGNGGTLGTGYGNGIQKYNYLPEIHTDFISSALAEEWGFVAMLLLIGSFVVILQISIAISIRTANYLYRYLVIGSATLIFTQMLINLYVAIGLFPVMGLPLPFFSYGGSATVSILVSLGLMLGVSKTIARELDESEGG